MSNRSPAQFRTSAQGSAPLSYQWFINETNLLVGATNAELIFSNVTVTDAGPYLVVVTNPFGAVTSHIAQLTVLLPPQIVAGSPGQSVTITNGSPVTFSVFVEGTPPLAYQWFFEDSPLSGATNSILQFSNVTLSQSGQYSVFVSNARSEEHTSELQSRLHLVCRLLR